MYPQVTTNNIIIMKFLLDHIDDLYVCNHYNNSPSHPHDLMSIYSTTTTTTTIPVNTDNLN